MDLVGRTGKRISDVKESLTTDTVMSYFYPWKETQLSVDESLVGLAAILLEQ